MEFEPVYCSKCRKVIGEIKEGTVRLKCKCGTITTTTINIQKPAPQPRQVRERQYSGSVH